MTLEEFRKRTKQYALRVVKVCAALPKDRIGDVFARQLVKSGTSVAANYRAACRARSPAEFISKIGIAEEAAEKFFHGSFAGQYEQNLIDEFLAYLPERPPWKQ